LRRVSVIRAFQDSRTDDTAVNTPLSQVLAHSEKLGLAWDPSVDYWHNYYERGADGVEPIGTERIRVFREALRSLGASGLWLEAGCGIGVMARQFRESGGLRMCAIDVSVELLKEAQHVTGLQLVAEGEIPPGDEYLARSAVERTPYPDEHFDGAYASSVLEYCADLGVALTELHRIVKTDGHLVFNMPNAFSIFRTTHALARLHLRLLGRNWYYRLVPRWAYWKWDITRLLKLSGWAPLRFTYYGYEKNTPSVPEWVPGRRRLAVQPWAGSFVLVVARRVGPDKSGPKKVR
jgi:SAM-dependent methyltransferase